MATGARSLFGALLLLAIACSNENRKDGNASGAVVRHADIQAECACSARQCDERLLGEFEWRLFAFAESDCLTGCREVPGYECRGLPECGYWCVRACRTDDDCGEGFGCVPRFRFPGLLEGARIDEQLACIRRPTP